MADGPVAELAAPEPAHAARSTPWALPYLVGLALPLGMLSGNVGQMARVEWYPLAVGLAGAALFDLASRLLLRRSPVRSLLAAVGTYWFVGFGNFDTVYHAYTQASLMQAWAAWTALLTGLALLIHFARAEPLPQKIGAILQISLLVMVGLQLFTLRGVASDLAFRHTPALPRAETAGAGSPDIYYIILDAYARADTLRRLYDHDNQEFLAQLEQRGFQVASKSRSNYNQTTQSLSSSLNMEYLDELGLQPRPTRIPLVRLMSDAAVPTFLKEHGYTTVSVATGYSITEQIAFDEKITTPAGRDWWTFYPPANEFQLLALNLTALAPALQADLCDAHRQRIHEVLARLPDARRERSGPTFVLAHLLVPHPPFLFDEDGGAQNALRILHSGDGPLERADIAPYRSLYRDQLRFTNREILECIDQIIAASERPVCIILQGDHGPRSQACLMDEQRLDYYQERYSILNAVRSDAAIPADLTPVNTFRIMLNHYFGTKLPMLANRAIFVPYDASYEFQDISEELADQP